MSKKKDQEATQDATQAEQKDEALDSGIEFLEEDVPDEDIPDEVVEEPVEEVVKETVEPEDEPEPVPATPTAKGVALYEHRQQAVEAMPFTRQNADECAAWCGGSVHATYYPTNTKVLTLPDGTTAEAGSWIVKHGTTDAPQYTALPGAFFEQVYAPASKQ